MIILPYDLITVWNLLWSSQMLMNVAPAYLRVGTACWLARTNITIKNEISEFFVGSSKRNTERVLGVFKLTQRWV